MQPQPSHEFHWTQDGHAPALTCGPLEPFARHLFTSRKWLLGSSAAHDAGNGCSEIAAAMHVPPAHILRVHQVHGAGVLIRRAEDPLAPATDRLVEADIIVTNDRSVGITVRAADCVPMLIADRQTGAIGAAHAGWRGLATSVPNAAVKALVQAFGSDPSELIVAIGPSIRACCYEVGDEVRQRFIAAGFPVNQVERWFFSAAQPSGCNRPLPTLPAEPRPGHWYFDSSEAARDQLVAAGIPAAHIFASGLCTASHPEWLCSYRRDGHQAGRMVAIIKSEV